MQLDGTIQMPDGRSIPVLVDVDPRELQSRAAAEGLAAVIARAIEVIGDRSRAMAWLRCPLPALDGKTPLEVLDTPEGRNRIEEILGRVEHGVFG